jgi:hypothetical protein
LNMFFTETNWRIIPNSVLPPGTVISLKCKFPALWPWIPNYTRKSHHRCSEDAFIHLNWLVLPIPAVIGFKIKFLGRPGGKGFSVTRWRPITQSKNIYPKACSWDFYHKSLRRFSADRSYISLSRVSCGRNSKFYPPFFENRRFIFLFLFIIPIWNRPGAMRRWERLRWRGGFIG